MSLIDPARIRYPRNFLKNVIFRVDFSKISSIDETLKPEFQKAIQSTFSKREQPEQQEYIFEFKNNVGSAKTKPVKSYIFQDSDNREKLTITSTCIILSVSEFKGFDTLKDHVGLVVSSFNRIYKPISISRLGLRYINEFIIKQGSPYDWEGYINPSLIQVLSGDLFPKKEIASLMSQIVYKRENFDIIFSFGLGNSEFPNRMSRKEFILDYDCSTQEADFDSILSAIAQYNEDAVMLFEKSIGDKMRVLLNGETNE